MVNRDESVQALEGYTTQRVDFVKKKKKPNKHNIYKLNYWYFYNILDSQISWTPLATGIWINHVKKLSENTRVLAGIYCLVLHSHTGKEPSSQVGGGNFWKAAISVDRK